MVRMPCDAAVSSRLKPRGQDTGNGGRMRYAPMAICRPASFAARLCAESRCMTEVQSSAQSSMTLVAGRSQRQYSVP